MSSPEVTVLTPVRNGERYLRETIESIRAQTFADWEYILVDDASTDDTPNIIDGYVRSDPRFHHIRRSEASGPYAAANEGVRHARGRYIVGTDADDVSAPARIATQIGFLQANSLRMCMSRWRTIDAAGDPYGDVQAPFSSSARVLRWSLAVVSGALHSSLCMEREAFTELGGYREMRISADYGLWLESARRGWLGVVPEVLVDYRTHEQGISNRYPVLRAECVEILGDHMSAMTGETWTEQDASAMWGVARWERMPLRAGFRVLDRWERAWRADDDLEPSERRELRRLGAKARARHVKWNHGWNPFAVASGAASWVSTMASARVAPKAPPHSG